MKLYNCRIQLASNLGNINPHHEVPKIGITRAEVIIMRALHGKDAVIDLHEVGQTEPEVTDMDIYGKLAGEYGARLVERLFNVQLTDLSMGMDEDEDLEAGLGSSDEPVIRGGSVQEGISEDRSSGTGSRSRSVDLS